MKISEGFSLSTDGESAVKEATEHWELNETPNLSMILAFCSTKQDPQSVASAINSRFPGVPFAGCTTSGEHLSGQHHNGSLVLVGIQSPKIRWATQLVEGLSEFDKASAEKVADKLFDDLGFDRSSVDPEKTFCLLLIDGLAMQEERIAAILAESIEGVPLLGGSAGDDLAFRETQVFTQGISKSNSAVLIMGYSEIGYEILKHQHFKNSSQTLAITRADVPNRRVYEIDGLPAAQAYASALGISRSELTDQITFQNPVTFLCNNETYVRSIQKIEDDDSIIFYCGIEEGMVLDIGAHEEMVDALDTDLANLASSEKATLLIGCNCILRALEAQGKDLHGAIGSSWSKVAEHSIGFDTYGEQLNGLHINQTLVALAFKAAA